MSQYEQLDALIFSAISSGHNALYERDVTAEAFRLAVDTGRESFRVIDGRLQALRKASKIEHVSTAGFRGWKIKAAA